MNIWLIINIDYYQYHRSSSYFSAVSRWNISEGQHTKKSVSMLDSEILRIDAE